MSVPKFYSLDAILKYDAKYFVIYGERSNGKTFAVLAHGIQNYLKRGELMGYLRYFEEDIKGANAQQLFIDNFVHNAYYGNLIEQWSKGEWNWVQWYSGSWTLQKRDDEGNVIKKDKEPFCYRFTLSKAMSNKGPGYARMTTLLFDEFLTRDDRYMSDPFTQLMNVVATIVRAKANLKIFMCGNTVNKYSVFFKEMGINIKNQKKGTINLYQYGESGLKVAVEYADFPSKKKDSDIYFAFDNPKLRMITNGEWELSVYPHMPLEKVKPKEIIYRVYLKYDGELLQGDVISRGDALFLFWHRKTSEIDDHNGSEIIYQLEDSPYPNVVKNILRGSNRVANGIAGLITNDKVFYQDNEVGETFRSYLQQCQELTARG